MGTSVALASCHSSSGRPLLPVRTLVDTLAAEDLGDLLLDQLISLLTDGHDLLPSDAELGNLGQDLLGDLPCSLILGEGVRVVEGII
jgi:hypothetical protein